MKNLKHDFKAVALIILMSIATMLISSCESQEMNCECEALFQKEDDNTFEVRHLPIDCQTGLPKEEHQYVAGGYFVKCKN